VTGNRGELSGTINGDGNVELVVVSSEEGGAELVVERVGDLRRDGPCDDGYPERRRCQARGVGGVLVVGVAGDAAVVEDEQLVSSDGVGDPADMVGRLSRGRAVRSPSG